MLADAHQKAALDIERVVADLGDPTTKPYIGRGVIELYWGAAFHWIAYGCQQKHSKHKENHTHLVSYLRDLGEPTVANLWDALDKRRVGGWYGAQAAPGDVDHAKGFWQDIRTWALS